MLPFDNRIVLCSVSGYKLNDKFINSTNSDYHNVLSDYGKGLSISGSKTYYIIVDTYTALYSPNGLTIIDYLDNTTFARDLMADAIRSGKLGGVIEDENYGDQGGASYDFISVSEAIEIGEMLSIGQTTTEYYYIKGIVNSNPTSYGNFYLKGENGETVYVYNVKDSSGGAYSGMSDPPAKGDTVILYTRICKYQYASSGDIVIELYYPKLIEINP